MPTEMVDQWKSVDAAFSKQSAQFDKYDSLNPVLQAWRERIYAHVDQFIKPNSKILELNAGTGIDALRFARLGHTVHAIDISIGMIKKMNEKISLYSLSDRITTQQISFDQLNQVNGKFDFVFSNFGGLNCIDDLNKVTRHLPELLNEGALITWVIMPRISPWEWLWLLKGKFKDAFRRFQKNGAMANVEGRTFLTYYYSLKEIRKSFGPQFQLIKSEGLGVFSPPPSATNFVKQFPRTFNFLDQGDQSISKLYPFTRWGDHLVLTFRLKKAK